MKTRESNIMPGLARTPSDAVSRVSRAVLHLLCAAALLPACASAQTSRPTTGVDHTPRQMRRSVHRPAGVTAEHLDEISLTATETLPHRECLPLGIGGDRHVTSMGGDFAVSEQVEQH